MAYPGSSSLAIPTTPRFRYARNGQSLDEYRNFSEANYQAFIAKVKAVAELGAKLAYAWDFICKDSNAKFKKEAKSILEDDSHFHLPFSLLKTYDEKGTPFIYVLTPLCVGVPGSNGVIKVAILLSQEVDGFKFHFSMPRVMKVVYTATELKVDKFWQQNLNATYPEHVSSHSRETKLYIASPLIRGEELFTFVGNYCTCVTSLPLSKRFQGKLDFIQRIYLCLQIATDLQQKFHKRGVNHGDLKSENIIISRPLDTYEFKAYLIDPDDGLEWAKPLPPRFAATLEYIPPEYACEDYKVMPESEVYSLGLIFLEILQLADIARARNDFYQDPTFEPHTYHDPRKRVCSIAYHVMVPADKITIEHWRIYYNEMYQTTDPARQTAFAIAIEPLDKLLKSMLVPDPTQRPNVDKVIDVLKAFHRQASTSTILRPFPPTCNYVDKVIAADDLLIATKK